MDILSLMIAENDKAAGALAEMELVNQCLIDNKYEGGEPSRVGNRAPQKCKPLNNSINSRPTTNLKVAFQRPYTLLEPLTVMAS